MVTVLKATGSKSQQLCLSSWTQGMRQIGTETAVSLHLVGTLVTMVFLLTMDGDYCCLGLLLQKRKLSI